MLTRQSSTNADAQHGFLLSGATNRTAIVEMPRHFDKSLEVTTCGHGDEISGDASFEIPGRQAPAERPKTCPRYVPGLRIEPTAPQRAG